MNYKHAILVVLTVVSGILLTPQRAVADSIIELGIHFGGGEIINAQYENGDKDTMKAGELFSFDFGRLYQLSSSWETQLTFGIKSDAIYEQDVEVSWVRYPLNGLVFYRMTGVRVGLGASYHFSPQLKGSGQAANIGEKYNDALGGLLEIDFIRSKKFLWGIRFTLIEYESKKDGHVVDGSSIGFLIIAQL